MREYVFKKAVSVWEKGKERERNYHLVFRTVVSGNKNVKVALAASNMYQMFVNGRMVAEGPARAGHGYYRVDEIDISKYMDGGKKVIAIYVAGYYVKNYYLIKQPAFLCAEVLVDGKVVSATGIRDVEKVSGDNEEAVAGFMAVHHSARIRRVARYCGQRTFTEAYRYDTAYKSYECDVDAVYTPVELVQVADKRFIERGVPYPDYAYIAADEIIGHGNVTFLDEALHPVRNANLVFEDPARGYPLEELELVHGDEVDKGIYKPAMEKVSDSADFSLQANTFAIYALPNEKTGFIKLEVECTEAVQLMAVFDEILTDGDVSLHRMSTVNAVIWFLQKGSYSLITNEPYSMKYIKLINKSVAGAVKVKSLGIVEYAFPYQAEELNCEDKELKKIYHAAIETFRQNTLDIYMDCPSRERAGWLCDSFFTARVEHALTGKSLVEKNFLENFIYTEETDDIVKGMFPMCYPADFYTHRFIPQWAMWYVLELYEYLERTGDRELVEAAKDKIFGLLRYFEGFENEDGLLEDLESWLFVEWSKANDFVDGVNYPTNMLYAKMLRVIGKLYDERYTEKAAKIAEVIRKQSYFDGFFHDHAIRQEGGSLKVVEADITETCQYYAFFSEVATPDTYTELWNILRNDFGPDRIEKGLWEHIYPSNAFIGYYLRLELMEREGYTKEVMENIKGFFGYMVAETGTLWEHNKPEASCNHGFASHVAVWIKEYDTEKRRKNVV